VVTIGAEVRAVPAWPGAPTNLYGLMGFPLVALQKLAIRHSFLARAMVLACWSWTLGSCSSGLSGRSSFRGTTISTAA
jgi:hypothetical protein